MEKKRKRFYFIPIIIIVVLLSGLAVMLLWNAILTDLFNFKPVSYGQALGLLLLCRILSGSIRPGPRGGFRKGGPPWRSKLMDLSEEEREKFKDEWRQRAAERRWDKNC